MVTEFLLMPCEPLLSGHPSSKRTDYIGQCRVYAADERSARMYAAVAFGVASDRPGITSPWLDKALVECSTLAWEADAARKGLVVPPLESGRPSFMAVGPNQGEVRAR